MKRSVVIAISAFHSDAAVISLVEEIFAHPHPEVGEVIVVDSLGSGLVSEIAVARQWSLRYINANTNLGSAGNLARRMELAAETCAEWCLCLNHDANWEADRLSALLSSARSRPRVGAVYPLLDHNPREPRWEDGRRNFNPFAATRISKIPTDKVAAEVLWSSSNSALYSLIPRSENIVIMSELWMGYEDLEYGIALYNAGWVQLSCRTARLSQVFDYIPRRLFGRVVYIPDKPTWYSYYNARNLILIWQKYGPKGIPLWTILKKLFQSAIKILLFEKNKAARLRLLYLGTKAGITGQGGKGPCP